VWATQIPRAPNLADEKRVRCQTWFSRVEFFSFIWLKSQKKIAKKKAGKKLRSP
jgi:hypothetical protein